MGLGTWNSSPEQIDTAVTAALKAGYRHIDGAYLYDNEQQIGSSLKKCMQAMNLKREEIFITSKVWCTHMRPEEAKKSVEKTLSDLQLEYVDLYLIHYPVAFQPSTNFYPKNQDGSVEYDDVSHEKLWKTLEKFVDEGKIKSLGLSNFNSRQIANILKICRIKPVNLQVEIHANFPNSKLVDYCKSVGLSVTAYAPLGSPAAVPGATNLLTEKWVCEIAQKHKKTPAQVLIRYLIQRGLIVVPKSVTPARIVENMQVFDFQLTDEEMQIMNTSGLNQRQFKVQIMKDHPEYPYNEEF